MTHVLCVHLPHWPIDRLRRRRPVLRHKPLVLVETNGNRHIVVHVSPEASREIYPGMTLAEAGARQAGLVHFAAAPASDRRDLQALGYWLMRFGPKVCVNPPASVFLDATGLELLYGGLMNFQQRIAQALHKHGIHATLALAPQAGAAWALAAFGKNGSHILEPEQLLSALQPLPPEALRLEAQTVEALACLGVRSIRDILQLDRNDLAVRFGPSILKRIDQAMGTAPETLTWLAARAPIRASLEFEGVVESLDVLQSAAGVLTRQLAAQLAVCGQGARELGLMCRRPYGAPIEEQVRLLRPCRDEAALSKLIGCVLENLPPGEGVIAMDLSVKRAEKLSDQQTTLINGEEERSAAEADHLVERLRARLGPAVEWGELVESHMPEYADRCRDTPGEAETAGPRCAVDILRPLRLLRRPRAIQVIVRPAESCDGEPVSFSDGSDVRRLEHVRGPERIIGQWWNGRWKTRDYFDVLDAAGGRYWIFRVVQSGQWFLHGLFE
ncbi:MAG: Y-family DNA polymerase [Phycisphaerae bacterium]